MAFEWKERYALQLEEIDRQHKKLFEIGARAYDLASGGDAFDHYDEILAVIQELLDYTEYHFGFEEALLTRHQYPVLDTHKQEHTYYVAKIKSISNRDIDGDQLQAIQDIVDFLSQWISSHIVFEDRKYAAYLKEKGAGL